MASGSCEPEKVCTMIPCSFFTTCFESALSIHPVCAMATGHLGTTAHSAQRIASLTILTHNQSTIVNCKCFMAQATAQASACFLIPDSAARGET